MEQASDMLADGEFGGKVARQTGAFISEERSEMAARPGVAGDDARRERAARFVDYRKRLAGMDFEQRVEATVACLERRASFARILFGLLEHCREERTYDEAEALVATFPECKLNRQTERRYIAFLLRTGAIEELELDERGNPITEARKREALEEGLDPEDLDTLVCSWLLRTTDVGEEALARCSPARRMAALFEEHPERQGAYLRVLEYCLSARSMEDIKRHLRDDPGLKRDPATGMPRVQASSYVDKLENAGGMAWDGGWKATEAGRTQLELRDAVTCVCGSAR